jgi:hypothetical protein
MGLKRIVLVFLILFVFSSLLSGARLGLGIIIGAPTGFSMKLWQSRLSAFDLAFAWDFDDDYFHLHGDYLYHIPVRMEGVSRSTLFWYLGIGARLKFRSGGREDDTAFGIRGVGGIDFLPREVPIDLFAEIAPVMNIVKDTKLDLEGGIGIRYNFNL